MVAGMALRLDRIWHCCAIHCGECPSWSNLSHHIPGGRSHLFWYLGQPLVRLQQRGDGMVGHIEALFVDRRLTALVAFGMVSRPASAETA
jgi:hypothetical protein